MTNVFIINMTIITILVLYLRGLVFIDMLTRMRNWRSQSLLTAFSALSDLDRADEATHLWKQPPVLLRALGSSPILA